MCLLATTLLRWPFSVGFGAFCTSYCWASSVGALEHDQLGLGCAVSSRLCCQCTWSGAVGNRAEVQSDTEQSRSNLAHPSSLTWNVWTVRMWGKWKLLYCEKAFPQCSILATDLLLPEEALTNKSSHHLGTSDFLKPVVSGVQCRKQVVFTGWLTNVLSSRRQRWCGSVLLL